MSTKKATPRKASAQDWARVRFERVELSLKPFEPEIMEGRIAVLMTAIQLLARDSDGLYELLSTPEGLDSSVAMYDEVAKLRKWLGSADDMLETLEMRLLAVQSRALLEHPEWNSLRPGFSHAAKSPSGARA